MKEVTPVRPFNRRKVLALSASWLAAGGFLAGCSPQAPTFKSTDITGAAFAQDLRLTDHTGQVRTLAEVKRLIGDQGKQLQVLFITVDPERDTLVLLKSMDA